MRARNTCTLHFIVLIRSDRMFEFIKKGVNWLSEYINKEEGIEPDNLDLLALEVKKFLNSPERKAMIKAYDYYNDKQDILQHKKLVVGEYGNLEEVKNVLNYKVTDNLYATHVDKKVSYLLGNDFAITTDNDAYTELLDDRFDRNLRNKINRIGGDMVKCGVGYLHPYYKDNELKFKRFKPYELKVYYEDDEKEKVNFFLRHFVNRIYTRGHVEEYAEFVDVYTKSEVRHYRYKNDKLTPCDTSESYMTTEEGTMQWEHFPLLVFKYNEDEQILLNRVKALQDGINLVTSNFQNNMLEDARNTILVIKNFDGANLGEFRKNLSTYGAVKIRDTQGASGGVDTLRIEIDSENYKLFLDQFKKALIKGMKSIDVDELKSGTPNQMNIQAMFNDIDQDATNMENEIQKTLDELLWFIDVDLALKGLGDFENEKVKIVLNRDMMQDETTIIDNVVKLRDLVSDETLLAQIPFIDDPQAENERMKQQKKEDFAEYGDALPNTQKVVDDDEAETEDE